MEIFETRKDLSDRIKYLRSEASTIGFVPTMGALHKGHLSLIDCSVNQNDFTVVSIFVNPAQFNDINDLRDYPRNLAADLKLLRSTRCNIVFTPSVDEVYPEPDNRIFNFGNLDKLMEGKFRPGHFNGVARVVTKLFEIVSPHKAYFGLKDFQQVAIIKKITRDLNFNIEIITCPTVREYDGLAMSSRNSLLGHDQRKYASYIYQALCKANKNAGKYDINAIKKEVLDTLNKLPFTKVEYFEIVDEKNLCPVKSWDEKPGIVGCIAVRVGNIRLIDNIIFNL